MTPQEIADTFDMKAIENAFTEAVKADIEPGQSFKTEDGSKWKFLAEKDNVFVARHGEFHAVMTLEPISERQVSIALEIKAAPTEE